jgi:molecular chaperone GrpE
MVRKTVEKKIEAEVENVQPPETAAQAVPVEENAMMIDTAVELEALRQELNEVRTKSDEYLYGWQRAQADFANYKKRVERDQSQIYQTTAGNILKRYLDILDDLERALKKRPQDAGGIDADGKAWADGIDLIYRKLQTILENEGVKTMQAQGQMFDPNLHEAVMTEDNPAYESGQVIEVLQQGYLLGDRVLRPAVVRVAR